MNILAAAPGPVREEVRMGTPDNETNYIFFENRQALVLAGGGARAA